jgi:hypothetical protein
VLGAFNHFLFDARRLWFLRPRSEIEDFEGNDNFTDLCVFLMLVDKWGFYESEFCVGFNAYSGYLNFYIQFVCVFRKSYVNCCR